MDILCRMDSLVRILKRGKKEEGGGARHYPFRCERACYAGRGKEDAYQKDMTLPDGPSLASSLQYRQRLRSALQGEKEKKQEGR